MLNKMSVLWIVDINTNDFDINVSTIHLYFILIYVLVELYWLFFRSILISLIIICDEKYK